MMMLRAIPLWPEGSLNNGLDPAFRPVLEVYAPAERGGLPRPAVVVLPGGGYGMRAAHEGEPFASLFARHGIFGFVAQYRVAPNRFPAPYADAARAMRMVRAMAGEWNINADKIGLMGFSAGGHLASTVAVQPDLYVDRLDDLAGKVSARPDCVILGYPVISMESEHHEGSALNLLGANPTPEQRRQFSNDQQVNGQSPPAFIFHTADDQAVPASNAMRFASACLRHKVPVELHIYRSGPHGVGMAEGLPELKDWTELLLSWLKAL